MKKTLHRNPKQLLWRKGQRLRGANEGKEENQGLSPGKDLKKDLLGFYTAECISSGVGEKKRH